MYTLHIVAVVEIIIAWIAFYAAINSKWYRRYTARRLYAYMAK